MKGTGRRFAAKFVCAMLWSGLGRRLPVALAVLACAMPLASPAQTHRNEAVGTDSDRWRWATVDQDELRVVALDERRQQVVVKLGQGELTPLRRGGRIPHLSVSLEAVSGRMAVFQPLNLPGREAVERIEITASHGRQVTRKVQSMAPAQSTASGWTVAAP
ncbi:Uncharacterised protein [Delftia tsuruhatensis]|nr:Uncharacterised protein [Delftia tsuruhatensis]CAC9681585.1 Uncharacterised protein [Delftia tsuruhatensis]